jgi:hypothetical protein
MNKHYDSLILILYYISLFDMSENKFGLRKNQILHV